MKHKERNKMAPEDSLETKAMVVKALATPHETP